MLGHVSEYNWNQNRAYMLKIDLNDRNFESVYIAISEITWQTDGINRN